MTRSPVNAAVAAVSPAWDGGVFEILFILIVFICILFLAYIVTRFIGKRSSGRLKSRYMEVVDTLGIGAETQLLIVKVGGELFLTSKNQKQISQLVKLEMTAGDLQEETNRLPGFAESFRSVLESKLSRARASSGKDGDTVFNSGARVGADTGADGESDGADAGAGTDGEIAGAGDRNPGRDGKTSVFRGNIDKIKGIK